MELEELEMISNKVKFGIVIIGLLGGLFLVLHYVIYPNLATGETRYLLWKSILETLFSSLSVAVILGGFRRSGGHDAHGQGQQFYAHRGYLARIE